MKEKLNFLKYKGVLSRYAFDPINSRGRRFQEDEELALYGDVYDPFVLDIDKIRLGKFYRRLYDKTQVFPLDTHSNIRNRKIHTDEVVSFSSLAAKILGLNQNLAKAIAYGHDIGHTPFGHLGEKVLSQITGRNFSHATMSVVIAQKIERAGCGLNLSYESLEGIYHHSRGGAEMTPSGKVSQEANLVMIADKICYTFSDLNDAIKLGYIQLDKTLNKLLSGFSLNQRESMDIAMYGLIKESATMGYVSFSFSNKAINFADLRTWMYRNVYFKMDEEAYREKKYNDLERVLNKLQKEPLLKGICPFLTLAILTDSEANKLAANSIDLSSEKMGFMEIIKRIIAKGDKFIDIFDADFQAKDFSLNYGNKN